MELRTLKIVNDADYEKVLENFGGRNVLEKSYPRILKMLEDTREMRLASPNVTEPSEEGYTDTYRVTEVPLNEQADSIGLFVESYMSMVDQYPMLIMTSKTWDKKTGKVLSSFSIYDTDVHKLENKAQIDHSCLNYTDELTVTTETTFYSTTNINGKSVLAHDPVVCTLTIDLSTKSSIVSRITVKQPKEKDGSAAIRVVYNDRSDPNAAYTFTEVKDPIHGNTRYVEVYYPFLIEIELAGDGKDFIFSRMDPVSLDKIYMTLASEVIDGGAVHFNTAMLNNIYYDLINDHTLSLNFEYEKDTTRNFWGVSMPLITISEIKGAFDFHLNFPINVYSPAGLLTMDIIVTSESIPKSDNMAKIKYSNILWGCIGENAIIRTSDGDKKVQELSVGDMIYTERGYKRLINLVKGTENEIISISVEGCEELLLTAKHVIMAERGAIMADELTPNERIRLIDGSYKAISKIERITYNGAVYSPELEQSEMLFANGIMVGDYKIVPESDNDLTQTKTPPVPIDPSLRDELINWVKDKDSESS